MKTKTLATLGFLFIVSALTLQAQNTLADPHNDACWQSIDSLRACQIEQYNREASYAQSCTSYPEYQCNPSTADTAAKEEIGKAVSKTKAGISNNNRKQTLVPAVQPLNALAQTADSK